MVLRNISSIPKSVCSNDIKWYPSLFSICNDKEFCPKNICSNKNSIVRTGAYFLSYSIQTEIKGSTVFASMSFFLVRTFVYDLIFYHSNSVKRNPSIQFEHRERDICYHSISFERKDWICEISSER